MSRFLSLLIFITLGTWASAQKPMAFSAHVDPQFGWFTSDEEDVLPGGTLFHLQAGLDMDYFFAPNYALSLGLGITNLGGGLIYNDSISLLSKSDTLWVAGGRDIKHQLQYIEIPLGIKLKTEELGYTTFYLKAGFTPMVRINAFASTDDKRLDKEDIEASTPLFNLGYHIGAGVEYTLGGSTALVGGFRWSAGLTDVTGNDLANVNYRLFSVQIGLIF
ncbi:MAG: porin family protein [Bacteroidales bacterium]